MFEPTSTVIVLIEKCENVDIINHYLPLRVDMGHLRLTDYNTSVVFDTDTEAGLIQGKLM